MKAVQRQSLCLSEEKTSVLWHINSCPIPDGYDPRLVGPRIESALKKSGYSGPLAITAIGDLRKTPGGDKVLRELASTGIAIEHSRDTPSDIQTGLFRMSNRCTPPGTIMLISGPCLLEPLVTTFTVLERAGYRILLAYPQQDPAPDWLWKSFFRDIKKEWLWKSLLEGEMDSSDNKQETTRLVLPDLCPETDESPWYCSVCPFAAQSIEDLTTHLKSLKHAYYEWDRQATRNNVDRFECKPEPPNNDPDTIKEWDLLYNDDIRKRTDMMKMMRLAREERDKEDKKMMHDEVTQYKNKEKTTLVLWHINSCPIPDGYDPRLVGPRIESALKNSGCSGSLTITAIGDLTRTPGVNVLRELSSTGIALKHTHAIEADLFDWTRCNPPLATIMLISGPCQLECLAPALHRLSVGLYRILLAYPQRDPAPDWLWKSFFRDIKKEWLWKTLLEAEMDSGSADKTTRHVLQNKCSETGESPWSCSVCHIAAQSFEDFTTHLNMHIK